MQIKKLEIKVFRIKHTVIIIFKYNNIENKIKKDYFSKTLGLLKNPIQFGIFSRI